MDFHEWRMPLKFCRSDIGELRDMREGKRSKGDGSRFGKAAGEQLPHREEIQMLSKSWLLCRGNVSYGFNSVKWRR
jgi:hypothetical protein